MKMKQVANILIIFFREHSHHGTGPWKLGRAVCLLPWCGELVEVTECVLYCIAFSF